MLRSVASKVMWVGRATVFGVGFAIIGGLVFATASMAFGAVGQPFLLGRNSVATALTKRPANRNGAGGTSEFSAPKKVVAS